VKELAISTSAAYSTHIKVDSVGHWGRRIPWASLCCRTVMALWYLCCDDKFTVKFIMPVRASDAWLYGG